MNADDITTTLRARAVFEASVEHVDADTCRRLRASRLQALQASARPAHARWIWPVGMATAAALALAVFLPILPHSPTATNAGSPAVVASERQAAAVDAATKPGLATTATDAADTAALDTADPDMLSELDFYGWLATQPDNKGHLGG